MVIFFELPIHFPHHSMRKVISNIKNTYHRIDADGNRTFNKLTNQVVNEATDKGSEMEELVVRGQAKINNILIQKVGDQVWFNCLLYSIINDTEKQQTGRRNV